MEKERNCNRCGVVCCVCVITIVVSLLSNRCVVCCHCAIAVEKAKGLERGERGQ